MRIQFLDIFAQFFLPFIQVRSFVPWIMDWCSMGRSPVPTFLIPYTLRYTYMCNWLGISFLILGQSHTVKIQNFFLSCQIVFNTTKRWSFQKSHNKKKRKPSHFWNTSSINNYKRRKRKLQILIPNNDINHKKVELHRIHLQTLSPTLILNTNLNQLDYVWNVHLKDQTPEK